MVSHIERARLVTHLQITHKLTTAFKHAADDAGAEIDRRKSREKREMREKREKREEEKREKRKRAEQSFEVELGTVKPPSPEQKSAAEHTPALAAVEC